MAACLIIGGAGFIGSHLVDALLARGEMVRVLDNFSTGTHANLSQSKQAVELIAEDLNVPGVLEKAIRGVEYVFHFMEPPSATPTGQETAGWTWASTVDSQNVLTAALEAGVHRVIYASCGTVYGPPFSAQIKESDPTSPVCPRGFAKQAAENQCAGFTRLYGLETVRLRFFNVFGPRQSLATRYLPAVPAIVHSMLAGQDPVIPDSPFEQYDLLYVADAVHATFLATEVSRAAVKVYNIARGRSVALVQVVNAVNQILGTHLQPLFADARQPSGLAHTVDISRAEADLGFCPSTDLRQGLSHFIEYLQSQATSAPHVALDAGHSGLQDPHLLARDHPPCSTAKPTDSGHF